MRVVLILTLLLSACDVGLASEIPVAGFEPVFFNSAGWKWGAFEVEEAVQASDDGFQLYVEPADDGTTNGGIGMSFGSRTIDAEDYQLEIPVRVLPDNEAAEFRITMGEVGTPEEGEEYIYRFNLFELDEDEWTVVERPLIEFDGTWTTGGDFVQDFGLHSIQLQSIWNVTETLSIEVGGVFVSPIDKSDDGVAFEFNADTYSRGWTFGAFGDDDVVDGSGKYIEINAENPTGGLGTHWINTEFEAETHELVVRARLGEDNLAESFLINLKDSDGLDALGEQSAEEWLYEFETADFSEDEFVEVRLPLDEWSQRRNGFGAQSDGDEELNFGLFQIQLEGQGGGQLNLELDSVQIARLGGDVVAGDFDGNGLVDQNDIDELSRAVVGGSNDLKYDLNGDGQVSSSDRSVWITDIKNTYIGDANLDGEFNSSDFVQVFSAGQYETGVRSNWAFGDWNGDGIFDSGDFVAAFTGGGYELGPRAAVNTVPEPSIWVLLLFGIAPLLGRRRARGY